MELSEYALQQLRKIVSGDANYTPNQSGQNLVALFNSYGFRDVYNGGLPEGLSRNNYVEDRLKKLNGSAELAKLLEKLVSKVHFRESTLDRKAAVEAINAIIEPEKFGLRLMGGDYHMSGNVVQQQQVVTNQVHFEKIQQQILAELDKAEILIWVAVAWFTDPILFEKLIEKRRQGLSVQVLIIDDKINNAALPWEQEIPGAVKKLKPSGYFGNIAHHKFCVIDLEHSISGSYNWTVKAQYNNEDIVISDDRAVVKQFAKQFITVRMQG